jgi:arylsulfatase A-like enzyme
MLGLLFVVIGERRGWQPSDRLCFASGLAIGFGGLAGSWLTNLGGSGEGWRFAVPALTVVLLLLLPYLRIPPPSRRFALFLDLAGLGVVAVLLSGSGAVAVQLASVGAEPQRFPAAQGTGDASAPSGPDVILISVDTLRVSDLFRTDLPTPALDALVARSRFAPYALSPGPSAVPSYAGLFSGRDALATGTRDEFGDFVPRHVATNMTESFRDAGWRTLGIAWNPLGVEEQLVSRGFDVFHNLAAQDVRIELYELAQRGTWLGWMLPAPLDTVTLRWLTRQRVPGVDGDVRKLLLGNSPGGPTAKLATEYLTALADDPAPLFFFLHFVDLHQPYLSDSRFRGRRTSGMEIPTAYRERIDAPNIADIVSADLRAGSAAARQAADYLHAVYLEELMFVDESVGKVLAAVERSGRPTLILFTSNHGELFGEHDAVAHPYGFHEELLRVPFLISGPGIEPGLRERQPRLEDAYPTLLAACGVDVPAGLDGQDLFAAGPSEWIHFAASADFVALYRDGRKTIFAHDGLGPGHTTLRPVRQESMATGTVSESSAALFAEASSLIRGRLGETDTSPR